MTQIAMNLTMIPLNLLTASPRNVRRRDRKSEIEALAASIAAQGLLQNLCVVAAEGGRFEVDAGGRRLAALKLLARTGAIAKDWPVPCRLVAPEAGREVSLVENVHRVAMDAIDEVDAFAALVADGSSPDEIARRFGATRRHVDQRLALAGLSPKIKAAWKRGDVTLEAARAFCLVDDHGQQEAVFRSLARPVTHAGSVRARLMDGRVRASDRLAVYVGLEAYEAAGGKLLRDLFDADAVFIEDPGLLAKLAEEKLTGSRERWLADGWSWVDVHLGAGRGEGLSATRLHPEWRDPTPEEQGELDRISAEIEALDAELESTGGEDDERWSARDDLEAAYETIRQAGRYWSDDAKKLGGVTLSIDHEGEPVATEGLVRSADQKQVDAWLRQRRAGGGDLRSAQAEDGESRNDRTSALPKAVNRDLTLARTRAIRLAMSGEPDVALALCVTALVCGSLRHAEMTGIGLAAHLRQIDDLPALDEARAEIDGRLPSDEIELLDWALDLSRERLLAVLAVLVAGAIDLAHEDSSPADLRKQSVADRLSQHLAVDMRNFWQPDPGFWVRLPKPALLAALMESPSLTGASPNTREAALKAHAKLRKDELAAKVASAWDKHGYLPDVLVTPPLTGSLIVTREGEAALQPVAVAAE